MNGIIDSAVLFATDPAKMLLVVASLLIASVAFFAWKKYDKPALLYAHLFFVMSPFFYFALSINCSMSFAQGLLEWCTTLLTKFIIYLLPVVMALSFVAGYAIIPHMYRKISKPLSLKQFKELCRITGIKAELFLIDKAKPTAFALGRRIFISVGMFDLLAKKELEAVLLHELHHVKSRAPWNKFSSRFVRTFSPIAWFSSASVEKEERAADAFAVKIQKTGVYLKSAKRKVEPF